MTILKILFVAMLCLPLLYISGVLVSRLMDECMKSMKKSKQETKQ